MAKDQNRNETLNLCGIKQSEWFVSNSYCQGLLLRECVCVLCFCMCITMSQNKNDGGGGAVVAAQPK